MNEDRDTTTEPAIARLADQELYRTALRAARRGDRAAGERLYLVMAARGLPHAQQREVIEALFPAVRHGRGFLTTAEQQRAMRRFERSRR
jgi:hypothetical protein